MRDGGGNIHPYLQIQIVLVGHPDDFLEFWSSILSEKGCRGVEVVPAYGAGRETYVEVGGGSVAVKRVVWVRVSGEGGVVK